MSDNITPIRKVLIANRGEIAVRVMRTCKDMGIRTVAVCSEADRNAVFVKAADEAVFIGPSPALESYLVIDKIIAAAKKVGADAIHPGYGFLSENRDFADAVTAAGINFIGPLGSTMHQVGNKTAVKQYLRDHPEVPLIPGYEGDDQTLSLLKDECIKMGFPVLLKAAAGGGGKGMRIVRSASEVENAVSSVQSEARNSFGDEKLLIEKYFEACRHIEIQIFGDKYGNVIHLGERDCSVQRRHQKIIEESPSPFMIPELREKMGAAAVAIGKLTNYVGAGTVEFLVDEHRNFFFLEVNTRLQVEHPITELCQGLDLVKLQIEIAQGTSLRTMQLLPEQRVNESKEGRDMPKVGHAIECRLYAEDPSKNFFPATGVLRSWKPAHLPGLRYDSGVETGSLISVYYDPMIAKIISHGPTRQIALARMVAALSETVAIGLVTNQRFLLQVLQDPAFVQGDYSTRFLTDNYPPARLSLPPVVWPTPTEAKAKELNDRALVHELSTVLTLWDWAVRDRKRRVLRRIPSGWSNAPKPYQRSVYALKSSPSPSVHVQYQHLQRNEDGSRIKTGDAKRFQIRIVEDADCVERKLALAVLEAKEQKKRANVDQIKQEIQAEQDAAKPVQVYLISLEYESKSMNTGTIECDIDGVRRKFTVATTEDDTLFIHAPHAGQHTFTRLDKLKAGAGDGDGAGGGIVKAPLPCKVLKVQVQDGDEVKKGQLLVVVESMKMEMKIFAETDGTAKVSVRDGQILAEGDVMVHLGSGDDK